MLFLHLFYQKVLKVIFKMLTFATKNCVEIWQNIIKRLKIFNSTGFYSGLTKENERIQYKSE